MSVYVGIDVHRKRSQVAVAGAKGGVLANRNVPNGVEPILKVIGGLPPAMPSPPARRTAPGSRPSRCQLRPAQQRKRHADTHAFVSWSPTGNCQQPHTYQLI